MASFEVIREPSARYWYTWTPALIRAAEIAANSGNLRLAADLCEWMMGDDRLMAVLDTRSDALLGLPFDLLPCGDGRKSGGAVSALREVWDDCYPEPEIKKLHAWGIVLGVGLARNVWVEDEEHGLLPHLEVWSPRWLSWDWEKNSWMVEVAGADGVAFGTSKIPITPGDGEWILYTPSGVSRPWVHGAYRALARWCLLKQYAQQDLGFYSERLGQGVWVAETQVARRRQRHEGPAQGARRRHPVSRPQRRHRSAARRIAEARRVRRALAGVVQAPGRARGQRHGGLDPRSEPHDAGRHRHDGRSVASRKACSTVARAWTGRRSRTACARSRSSSGPSTTRATRGLAPKPWWDTTPIDDANAKATVEQLTSIADGNLVNAGVMTINEARAKRKLPPVPGGDALKGLVAPATTPTDDGTRPATDPSAAQGRIYGHHIEHGVVSINEARAELRLPPRDGYDDLVSVHSPDRGDAGTTSVDHPNREHVGAEPNEHNEES
jgi:hypothetical protein